MKKLIAALALPVLAVPALVVAAAAPAHAAAAAYYVNQVTGSTTTTAVTGTNPAVGWRSLAQVSEFAGAVGFQPGDQVLLKSGQVFGGQYLALVGDNNGKNRGTAAQPIRITTTAAGRAAISPPADKAAITIQDTAGIDIGNLTLSGLGTVTSHSSGISVTNSLPGNQQLSTVKIHDVEVSYFGESGVLIGGLTGRSGFTDVHVVRVSAHHNELAGIQIFGDTGIGTIPSDGCTAGQAGATQPGYSVSHVYIAHNTVYANPGRPCRVLNSGNGILLGSVYDALVERNVAYSNGARNTAVGGPIGIWTYDSDTVVIQHNESHGNLSSSTADGGGFDLDGGVTNSYLQYNYSHDNAGAGYLVAQYEGARPLDHVTVRYNISQNDGRKNGYAGIQLYSAMSNVNVYGNTVYVSGAGLVATPSAFTMSTPGTYPTAAGGTYTIGAISGAKIFNNIFYVDSGARLLSAGGGNSGVVLNNNRYHAKSGPFVIGYGGVLDGRNVYTGATYGSISAFRAATGQEYSGTDGAPGLGLERSGAPDVLSPVLANIDDFSTLRAAYDLRSDASVRDIGADPGGLTGAGSGGVDIFGTPVPAGLWYSVGAADR